MNMVRVPVVRLPHGEGLDLPRYQSTGAAGLDLVAAVAADEPVSLAPGQRIRLGGLVEEGSIVRGQGATVGFAVTDHQNSVKVTYTGILPDLFREDQGVITEGAFVILINLGEEPFVIARGDRIAQMVIAPVSQLEFEETSTLASSARGAGGFGSTGRRDGEK